MRATVITYCFFLKVINLIMFRIDGIVTIASEAIKIKSKLKFDIPYCISYL